MKSWEWKGKKFEEKINMVDRAEQYASRNCIWYISGLLESCIVMWGWQGL